MPFIRGNDVNRGTDVKFLVEVNGRRRDYIFATDFESKIALNNVDVPRICTREQGKKAGTVTMTGTATVYYMDPETRRIVLDYVRTGVWPNIVMIVRNEDKDSRSGAQTVIHNNVKFDEITLSKFGASTDLLDEQITFSYDTPEITEEFTELQDSIL